MSEDLKKCLSKLSSSKKSDAEIEEGAKRLIGYMNCLIEMYIESKKEGYTLGENKKTIKPKYTPVRIED